MDKYIMPISIKLYISNKISIDKIVIKKGLLLSSLSLSLLKKKLPVHKITYLIYIFVHKKNIIKFHGAIKNNKIIGTHAVRKDNESALFCTYEYIHIYILYIYIYIYIYICDVVYYGGR